MLTKAVCGCILILGIGFIPASPAPTNPLCYSSQAYHNTHEQECVIDQVPTAGHGGNKGPGGLIGLVGGLLHGLSGGFL